MKMNDCPHNNEELSEDGWTVFCQDCFEVLNGEDSDGEDDMVDIVVGFDLTGAWEVHNVRVPAMWTDQEVIDKIHDPIVEWMGTEDSGCSSMTATEVHR